MENERGRRRSRAQRTKLKKTQEIEHVAVQDSFMLTDPTKPESSDDYRVGEAAYVQATVNTTRYYGILIEQNALKAASMLHFQNEANGLEINRRMKALQAKREQHQSNGNDSKRAKLGDDIVPDKTASNPDNVASTSEQQALDTRQVQKFVYVEQGSYRKLLATFANLEAAGEDDPDKFQSIKQACEAGGDFVGRYYYQFEDSYDTLEAPRAAPNSAEMRMSLGFHQFLRATSMPNWFPLSNLQVGQQKVLNILSMKKDSNGNIIWDEKANEEREKSVRIADETMKQRDHYKIIVVGGGIAGIAASLELLKQCENQRIDAEVVLVEGRDRLGGRLWTDKETFTWDDNSFPVDFGASWIHGIDGNPLVAIAKDANARFVTASEDVKMVDAKLVEVDEALDTKAGDLFDRLLDIAADRCWTEKTNPQTWKSHQAAVRWYASGLGDQDRKVLPKREMAPEHRWSTDTNVDYQIGNALVRHKTSTFTELTEIEKRMLVWNAKNIEYALGANLKDLSMKFWDIDERNAFGGDHVMMKEGYGCIVEELLRKLERYKGRLTIKTGFEVKSIEYNRNTTTRPFIGTSLRQRKVVDLSDTCRVHPIEGDAVEGDFVVCALPLGVLKNSLDENSADRLQFQPDLPLSKKDAIDNVGFGLLNKIFLQFEKPFWRETIISAEQTSFGNATGFHPQYYMFFDIGKTLSDNTDGPAILMTLVSGLESAEMERKKQETVIIEVLSILRTMVGPGFELPKLKAVKITRWGSDKFARGSYTYLPPGATDDDFQLLQSPINENGDSLLLEGSETMRVFFAGEHTSSLHPSLAHGALLSGMRAAQEVFDTITFSFNNDDSIDRVIPIPLYRASNPECKLECSLCQLSGTRVREGTLLAFKKGSKELVVHNNCAEFSPEVEVHEGRWKNVLQACNRGKSIRCSFCGQAGATIGCHEKCGKCYHFRCAEDTGWRFEEDGKEFHCYLHRSTINDVRRISMQHLKMIGLPAELKCAFCAEGGKFDQLGKLVAFQKGFQRISVHQKCAQLTSIITLESKKDSRFSDDFREIFTALDRTGVCTRCGDRGASAKCSITSCQSIYHIPCLLDLNINVGKSGRFQCRLHGQQNGGASVAATTASPLFNHALFSISQDNGPNVAANDDIGTAYESDNSMQSDDDSENESNMDVDADTLDRLSDNVPFEAERFLCRLVRSSPSEEWGIEFTTKPTESGALLVVHSAPSHRGDQFGLDETIQKGDIIVSLNGIPVGSELDTVKKVVTWLSGQVDIFVEVARDDD